MSSFALDRVSGLKVLFLHLGNAPVSWYRMIKYAQIMASFDDICPLYPKFDPNFADENVGMWERNVDTYSNDFYELFKIADIIVSSCVKSTKFTFK